MAKIVPFIILTILVCLLFGKTLTGKEFFVTPDFGLSDILMSGYPSYYFLSESLKNHQLPLWNPQVATGFPQVGTITGYFNPINILAFYLLPAPLAFNLLLAFSFLICAIFTYLYCQSVKLSKYSSFLASVSFTFSSVMITQIVHFPLVQTLSFFPLELYLLETYIQRKKAYVLILFIFTLGLQILAGFYQIVLYSTIALAIYSLIRLKEEKHRLKIAVFLILAIAAGFLIGAIQLLPNWELTQISTRQNGLSQEEIKKYPYPPKHLITFLNPYLLGDPRVGTYPKFSENWGIFWENTGYVGIIPLLLACFALITLSKKNKYTIIFVVILIISTLLMLGKYTPTFLLYNFPPFSLFRVPARAIVFAAFAISILAAFGFNRLERKIDGTKKQLLILAILTFTLCDLFYFAINYHLRGETDKWLTPPQTANFVKADNSIFRIWAVGNEKIWNEHFLKKGWKENSDNYLTYLEALTPNYNSLFAIDHVANYGIIQTQRQQFLGDIINKYPAEVAKKILDVTNVKYFLFPYEIKGENLELVFKSNTDPSYYIYQNTSVLPRVFIATSWELIDFENGQFKISLLEKLNLTKTVLLEKPIEKRGFNTKSGSAEIKSYSNQKVEIDAQTNGGGILVLADSYYPGWKAYVDGKEVEILAANINQRAVVLEQGKHQITFLYAPKSFKIGATITIGTSLILLVSLLFIQFNTAQNSIKKTHLE